jgi:hypothetical protein
MICFQTLLSIPLLHIIKNRIIETNSTNSWMLAHKIHSFLSCINFAIFGYNHRVVQTFLSTITQPNQCNYGAGVNSRTSKLPFQSQYKLKSKTQRPILGLGFESSCFTWGFIPSMVICFIERNCSVFIRQRL